MYGENPRMSIRRARVVPIETLSINAAVDRVAKDSPVTKLAEQIDRLSLEEKQSVNEAESLATALRRLAEPEEKTDADVYDIQFDDENEEVMDNEEDPEDLEAELENKEDAVKGDVRRTSKQDLATFFKKFYEGRQLRRKPTYGELYFIYSIYRQADDDKYWRDYLIDVITSDSNSLTIAGPDIVWIAPYISLLKSLEEIIIEGTNVRSLPKEIANMPNLQAVVLSNNPRLKDVPAELEDLIEWE